MICFSHSISEPPSHILDSSSSYKPCVGTAYLLLEKLKCQLFAFLPSPLFGSLAAGEQAHNPDFRDKCLRETGEAHP